MSIIKLITPFILGLTVSLSTNATTIDLTIPWGGISGGYGASVSYTPNLGGEKKYFAASVNHSASGEQRIYFIDAYSVSSQNCSYESRIPESTTIIINNQAVKMSRWCKKFADTKQYYYEYTPATVHGHNYVINLFKAAVSPVKIQLNNETLYFPVIGFTRIWNSAGGNAI